MAAQLDHEQLELVLAHPHYSGAAKRHGRTPTLEECEAEPELLATVGEPPERVPARSLDDARKLREHDEALAFQTSKQEQQEQYTEQQSQRAIERARRRRELREAKEGKKLVPDLPPAEERPTADTERTEAPAPAAPAVEPEEPEEVTEELVPEGWFQCDAITAYWLRDALGLNTAVYLLLRATMWRNGDRRGQPRLSRAEVAEFLGATPGAVKKAYERLRSKGLLRVGSVENRATSLVVTEIDGGEQ